MESTCTCSSGRVDRGLLLLGLGGGGGCAVLCYSIDVLFDVLHFVTCMS